MPLLTQNKRIERVNSVAELFSKYPHLKESAKQFVSSSPESVDPKQLLYIQQREFASTTPADNSVSILGSDDATTCHLVVLRHTGSGATCLAHCDGSSTWTEVPLIVNAVTSKSNPVKEGRLELHLAGGFDDDRKTSHSLSLSILAAFQKQKEDIHLETCCITDMNDVITEGIHRPVVYGIGVNVKTGHVFPASFACRGPAEELRSARTFSGGQMVEVYDSSRELVKIGPCRWTPNNDMGFWLSQDDKTILQCDIVRIWRKKNSCFIQRSKLSKNMQFGADADILWTKIFVHVPVRRTSSLCPAHQIHHPVPAGSSECRRAVSGPTAAALPPL
ncbi:protein N-terminal asparagine amidohydrolase isoform X1 [Ctenopharyngodon idella]|uniref:protein N-terminal asparagine amidohydrolase isoform X1 n=1 Tax=Ctenopharyngodon idella TaxID=7959 RepID=UPI0022305423|nr:protein N-terminal asparagine amidohydrolase isoform X1 [Ctenopharyngodon idella]